MKVRPEHLQQLVEAFKRGGRTAFRDVYLQISRALPVTQTVDLERQAYRLLTELEAGRLPFGIIPGST